MLKGSLEEFALSDIFRLLSFAKKTGKLDVARAAGNGTVYFKDGDVYFAESSLSREPLGRKLTRAGVLSERQLMAALDEHAETGDRVGEILVSRGAINQEQLEAAIQGQVQDATFDLLRWDIGEFAFEATHDVVAEIPISVSVDNLIMEASRRLDELEAIGRKIPGPEVVLRVAETPPEGAHEINITPEEWRLLVLVDGNRTITDIAAAGKVDDFTAMRILHGLVSAGLVEVVPGDYEDVPVAGPTAARPAPTTASAATPVSAPAPAPASTWAPAPASPSEPPAEAADADTGPDEELEPEPEPAFDADAAFEPAPEVEAPGEPAVVEAEPEPVSELEPEPEAQLDESPQPEFVSLLDEPDVVVPPPSIVEDAPAPEPRPFFDAEPEPVVSASEGDEGLPSEDIYLTPPRPPGEDEVAAAADAAGYLGSFLDDEPVPPVAPPPGPPERPEADADVPAPGPRVDRASVVRELASLFSDEEPVRRPARWSARGREDETGDDVDTDTTPDTPKRIEDDDQLSRGLISRLIDGVKGL